MKIVVAHYHLRTGGVTSVIINACLALERKGHEVCVVSGEKPTDDIASCLPPVIVVDELGYAAHAHANVAETVLTKTTQLLGGEPDVWHIHNHNLGKGPGLPLLVELLAGRQTPMVLQPHDFAEDGRPKNYIRLNNWSSQQNTSLAERLYPQADSIRYAVLNHRDLKVLSAAGMPAVNLLPNAVDEEDENITVEPDQFSGLWIYPTRAIRRKNIGEVLLWAAIGRDADEQFAITRAPQNPEARVYYDPWVRYAEEKKTAR